MGWLSSLWSTSQRWDVPEGWRQGRGVWGGLVAGQVVTTASQGLAQGWQPRSLGITMMNPVLAGPVQCSVTDLKSGSSSLVREVTIRDSGEQLLTRATVVFGAPRAPTSVSTAAAAPAEPEPVPDVAPIPLGPPMAPEFTAGLTFRPVRGIPYSGETDSYTCGWIGMPSGQEDELTAAVIAALADAWWITAIVGLGADDLSDGVPPVATMDFALTFPEPAQAGQIVDDAGLWHVGRVVAGRDGYLTEQRQLFDSDGRLLAFNSQLVALGGTARS